MRWAVLLLTAAAAAFPAAARAERRSIALTAAQLSAAVGEGFPDRRCVLLLVCVTLSEPRVRLVDGDNHVYVRARVRPELPGAPSTEGSVEVRALPRYEASEGAFYADRAELVAFEFPGLPSRTADRAGDLSRGVLADLIGRSPVYTLDEGKGGMQSLARLALRSVQVSGGKLRLELGDAEPAGRYSDDPGPTRAAPASIPKSVPAAPVPTPVPTPVPSVPAPRATPPAGGAVIERRT